MLCFHHRITQWTISLRTIFRVMSLKGAQSLVPLSKRYVFAQLCRRGPSISEVPIPANLILSAESFEYQASRGFKTARDNLTRITSTSSEVMPTRDIDFHPEPDPSHIWITIHFAKRAQGREVAHV